MVRRVDWKALGLRSDRELEFVLADGTSAWCDGGPLDWRLARGGQPAVVPMVHLGRGSLRAIRGRSCSNRTS